MGIISDLGLNDSMTKEQVLEQLFLIRRKVIARQNSADAKKRAVAELQLDIINGMQNTFNKMADNFPDIQVLLGTYGFVADSGKLNNDLKEAIEAAAAGNGDASVFIGNFLGTNGREDLGTKWMLWAADCGAVQAYQICGCLLMEIDSDKAIKWFEKANQVNVINPSNIYNWGLILYRKNQYAQALEKFEKASAEGHKMAPYYIAEMYENGYFVEKDLKKALEQYQCAEQRGLQEAQKGIARVATVLNDQNISSNIDKKTDNDEAQPQKTVPNGYPVLVYKSNKNSTIRNLEDINIDNLKELVKTDEIAEKVEGIANDIVGEETVDKIKNLPWDKILIGVAIIAALAVMFN